MTIVITRFAPHFETSVREFNQRIESKGFSEFKIDPSTETQNTPASMRWELWLAVQESIVRGGYFLRHQDFLISGHPRSVAFYNLSVSEGVIDRRFAAVGLKMAASAMKQTPLLFALGMGGRDRPLPRMLNALGWQLQDVPFRFKALRPHRILRNLHSVRTTPLRRLVMDIASVSGIATAGLLLWQRSKQITSGNNTSLKLEEVGQFDDWVHEIWTECGESFSMIAVRDKASLNALYPRDWPRLNRLKFSLNGVPIGWAVTLKTHMQNDRHFGNLFVGTIVDCLSSSRHSQLIVSAVTQYLQEADVDLIVTNQLHQQWSFALNNAGYLSGPSNFIFAISPGLAKELHPLTQNVGKIHINRGDGDGPIHL